LWSIFIKNPVTKVIKATTECVATGAKKIDSAIEKIYGEVEAEPLSFMHHADNMRGRQLQKVLFPLGIIVILFKFKLKKTDYGKIYILPILSHVVTACIAPPDTAAGKAQQAVDIQTAAAGTLYIIIPPALYGTVLDDLIENMRNAKGANQVLGASRALNAQLDLIMAPVQAKMNTLNPIDAAIVCAYYKFHVKGMGGKHEQVFEGETGTQAGEVDLILPVGPVGCAYGIKIYNLDRTSFVYTEPTDITHLTLGGFVPGSAQQLSVVIVSHGKFVSESQIISVRAK
jgi:hypothetical protein